MFRCRWYERRIALTADSDSGGEDVSDPFLPPAFDPNMWDVIKSTFPQTNLWRCADQIQVHSYYDKCCALGEHNTYTGGGLRGRLPWRWHYFERAILHFIYYSKVSEDAVVHTGTTPDSLTMWTKNISLKLYLAAHVNRVSPPSTKKKCRYVTVNN